MRKSVRELMGELERYGVRLLSDGRLHLAGEAPPSLLLRAHRNRRALMAALRAERG